jgi:hypothetical protein
MDISIAVVDSSVAWTVEFEGTRRYKKVGNLLEHHLEPTRLAKIQEMYYEVSDVSTKK